MNENNQENTTISEESLQSSSDSLSTPANFKFSAKSSS